MVFFTPFQIKIPPHNSYIWSCDFYLYLSIVFKSIKHIWKDGDVLSEKKKSKFCKLGKFKISDITNLLEDINIELKGNREAIIEGCKNIAQYDENMIRVNMNKMSISFFGRNLEIKCLNYDSLVIKGFITSIEFIN